MRMTSILSGKFNHAKLWNVAKHTTVLLFITLLAPQPVVAKGLPGASQTSYGVNAGGIFQFKIPIVVPSGRNGVQPGLSLSFSSSAGNGSVGVGWGLSGLGAITRCGRTFATDGVSGGVLHDENDKFCLNGQRLIKVSSGTYGGANTEYRTEVDSFAKIIARGSVANEVGGSAPDYWEVWHKNGMIHEYGKSTSKFALNSGSVHFWKLSQARDRSGNSYDVSYTQAYRVPDEITYQGGHKVKFNYSTRTDVRTSYVLGQKITRNQRLSSITVSKNGDTIRQYNLGYQYAALSKRSRLTAVTECGLNGECLLPISIQWQNDTPGFATTNVAAYKAPESTIIFDTASGNMNREITKGAWADVNGDGRLDQIIAYRGRTGGNKLRTYLQKIDTNGNVVWDQDANFALPKILRDYSRSYLDASFLPIDVLNQGQLVDVNGDGLVDIVYAIQHDWSDRSDLDANGNPTRKTRILQETWINKGNDADPNNRKGWRKESTNPAHVANNYTLPDIIYSYLDNSGAFTHYKGAVCSAKPEGCLYSGYVETTRGRFVDINGDGLVDWVRAYHVWNGTNKIATWINTGTKWQRNNTYDMPDVFAEYRGMFSLRHGELIDVNGDGRPDWVQSYHSNTAASFGGGKHTGTWLNTENGFVPAAPHFELPNMLYENIGAWQFPRVRGSFVDVNGDGRRDFVLDNDGRPGGSGSPQSIYGGLNRTWLNTGKGWEATPGYNVPFQHKNHRYIGDTSQTGNQGSVSWPSNVNGYYIDLNRDGLVDYTQSYSDIDTGQLEENTWINTGSGWAEDPSFNTQQIFYNYAQEETSKVRYGDFLDINNDGSPDWVRSRDGMPMLTKLGQTGRADQVSKITTLLGLRVSPTFATLNSNANLYSKGVGVAEADSYHVTGSIYVVSQLSTTSGNGVGNNITKYYYGGAQAHRKGRGYLGFKTFDSVSLATGLTQSTVFRQDYPYISRVSESVVRETANTNTNEWLSKTSNTYQHQNLNGSKTVFPFMSESTSEKAELDSNGGSVYQWGKTTSTYEPGNYGRMQSTVTQVGTSAADVQLSSTVGYTHHTADLTNWLIAQVKDTTTTRTEPNVSGSSKTRKDAYTYYPVTGQLHTTTREPDSADPAVKLITSYLYDSYGNITQETTASTGTGAETRTNTISYDPATSYRLPKSLSNALSQESFISYHPQCDTPSLVTSIDGQQTSFTYDNFCRQTSVTDPASVSQTTQYHYLGSPSGFPFVQCGSSHCADAHSFSITSQVQNQPSVTVFYNFYGKQYLSVTNGMALGQVIKQETEYDSLGRVQRQSQPYYAGNTIYWTSSQYDLLNRVTKTILPYPGATTTNAEVRNLFSVDANNRQQRQTINALGRTNTVFANALGQVAEIKDARDKSLTYDYDSQGNLIKTTDSAGNEIIVGYDILGRRTSLNDPDMGLSTYTLDAFSQQRVQTDAKNQALTMRYDALGRLTERDVPLTPDPNSPVETSYFNYDDPIINGIGKLSSVYKGVNGQQQNAKHYGYDQFGRPDATVTYVNGQRFEEALTYNVDGQLDTRSYPSSGLDAQGNPIRFAVKYDYINGYLSEISGIDAVGVKCISHWKAEEYDALGRTKAETLGNIITTTRSYDQAQGVLRKIESIVSVGTAGTVQHIDYDYDVNNNLNSRHDLVTAANETFIYDELDRLRFYEMGPEALEVRYDDLGNITFKSDVGAYVYTGQGGPHAVSRVDSPLGVYNPLAKFQVDWDWNGEQVTGQQQANIVDSNYQYDANGNITLQGNRSVSWTAFNKPASMMLIGQDGNQRGSLIEYDATFNRHYKQEGVLSALSTISVIKETTYYVGKEYEKIVKGNGDTLHRYTISTGGGTIQVERQDGSDRDKPMYLLGDNLGSTNVIVNAMGEVEQRLAFDPWGMRTAVAGVSDAVNGVTNRGYTGHEMDDEVGLINMNARIYDPYLGRFLSADPLLPDVGDMQSYNRYSYVRNNPLKYVDPTGNLEEQVDGGSGQKPDETIKDVQVVTGQRISSPPANGARRHTTIDLQLSSGDPLYLLRDGRIGTEEELFGAGNRPFSSGEANGVEVAIASAQNRENATPNGRLRDQAREDREAAQYRYLSNLIDQAQTHLREYVNQNARIIGKQAKRIIELGFNFISENALSLLSGKSIGFLSEVSLTAGLGGVGGLAYLFDRYGSSVYVFAGLEVGASMGFAGTGGGIIYGGPRNGLKGFGAAAGITATLLSFGFDADLMFSNNNIGGYLGPAFGGKLGGSAKFTYSWLLEERSFDYD